MAIDRRKTFTKQPRETYPIDVDFSEVTPLGNDEIVSATASAVGWPRREPNNKTDATSEVLLYTNLVVVSGICSDVVRLQVQGGQHNYDYQITILVTYNNGSIIEDELYMRVREE